MRIRTEKLIADFVTRHTQMMAPLARWSKVISAVDCSSFNELKHVFPSVDYVRPYTIFNVAGNHVRVIASVDFATRTVAVRWVLTHAEYDKWNKSFRKGKVRQ